MGRKACASALIVRWGSRGPVSMPSTSQIATTRTRNSHADIPKRVRPPPFRPGLGQLSPHGVRRTETRRPRRPRQNNRVIATTMTNEQNHVTIAGVVERWKALAQPHQAHNARADKIHPAIRWTRTSHIVPRRGGWMSRSSTRDRSLTYYAGMQTSLCLTGSTPRDHRPVPIRAPSTSRRRDRRTGGPQVGCWPPPARSMGSPGR